jgi:hypothetical protein
MFKTAGTLAIAVALLLPLSACGSTPATSAAPSAPVVTAAPASPEPAPVTSESSSSPSVAVPTPSPSDTDAPLLMAKNSSPWDASPEQIEEDRVALCVGIDGGPPILRKGIVTRGFEVKPGDFLVSVRESADGAESRQSPWDFGTGYEWLGWNGELKDLLGRLTLADVAVGKTVYFLINYRSNPMEYRAGDSPWFSTVKMPGFEFTQEAAVFPASACAGLRD